MDGIQIFYLMKLKSKELNARRITSPANKINVKLHFIILINYFEVNISMPFPNKFLWSFIETTNVIEILEASQKLLSKETFTPQR
jgi:hypothetical protein